MNPKLPLCTACLLAASLAAQARGAIETGDGLTGKAALNAPDLRIDGALHQIMHDGDFSPTVTITPSLISPETFGVGAVAGLDGEVTIIGGRCWVSAVHGGSLETRVDDGDGVEATLLVTAAVGSWSAFSLADDATLAGLADQIRAHATTLGIGAERPLVFRMAAILPEIEGHVIDGSKISPGMSHAERHEHAVDGRLFSAEPGMLVGFVSAHHEGIFTHRGESVHAHAVLAASGVTVHVDRAVVPEGAVVELGVEPAAPRR